MVVLFIPYVFDKLQISYPVQIYIYAVFSFIAFISSLWFKEKVLVKDVSDYQDFLKRVLKANIGLRRYFSYAVLDKIKDTDVVPDSLIRRSGVIK